MRQNGVRSDVRFPTGAAGMKKGGSAKKKKQGYKDRKDESIAMRVKKKRSAKQLKASADDSYGKFGFKEPSLYIALLLLPFISFPGIIFFLP